MTCNVDVQSLTNALVDDISLLLRPWRMTGATTENDLKLESGIPPEN